jgi:hypothetical protein
MSRPVSAGRPAPVLGSRPPSGSAHPPQQRQAQKITDDEDDEEETNRDADVTRALEAKEERIRQAELLSAQSAEAAAVSEPNSDADERDAAVAERERQRDASDVDERESVREREAAEAEERECARAAAEAEERERVREREAAEAEERECARAAAEALLERQRDDERRERDAAEATRVRQLEVEAEERRDAVNNARIRECEAADLRQVAEEAEDRLREQEKESAEARHDDAEARHDDAEARHLDADASTARSAADEEEQSAADAVPDREVADAPPAARRSPTPPNYSDDDFESSSPRKDDSADESSEHVGAVAKGTPDPEDDENNERENRGNEVEVQEQQRPPQHSEGPPSPVKSPSASRDDRGPTPTRSVSSRSRRSSSSSSSSSSSYEPLAESQNSARKLSVAPLAEATACEDGTGSDDARTQQKKPTVDQSKPLSAPPASSSLSTPPRKRSSASAGEAPSAVAAATTDTPRHVAASDTVQSLFSARCTTSSRVKSGASQPQHGGSMTDSGERRNVGDVRRWMSPYAAPMVGHTRLVLKDVCDLEEQRKKEVEVYRQKVKDREDDEKQKRDEVDAKAAERKKISTPSPHLCKPRHQKPRVGPYAPAPPSTTGAAPGASQERSRRRLTVDSSDTTSGNLPHYMRPLPPKAEPRPILFRPQTQQFKLHSADDDEDGNAGDEPVALTSEEFAARFYQAQVEAHDSALNKTFLKLTGAPKPPPPPLRDLSNLLKKDGPPRAIVKDDEEEEEIDEEEEKRLEFAREMGRKHHDDALANQQRARELLMTKYLGAAYATVHNNSNNNTSHKSYRTASVAEGVEGGAVVSDVIKSTRDLRTEPLSPSEKRFVQNMYAIPLEHQKETLHKLWNRMEQQTNVESLHRDTVMSPEKWTATIGRLASGGSSGGRK